MCALVGDLATTETALHAVADFPNVFALHAPWPRADDYWEQLKAKSAGTRIALVWGGNEHNLNYFFQSRQPFDFVSRHVSSLAYSFNIIPRRKVRERFNTSGLDKLRSVLADLAKSSVGSISVIGTPPPKKDNEQLRKILINEPVFLEWIKFMGEDLDTVKITPPHVRLKLWYLLQEMLEESAHEVGGKFIPVLAEAQDEAGYLRPEYWYHDVTHANRLYGGLMLRRVIEELG